MFKALFAGLLAITILFPFLHPSVSIATANRASNSILRLTGQTADKDKDEYVCTAFQVGESLALTAAHCMGSEMKADGKPAKEIFSDKYYDVAVIQVETHRPIMIIRNTPVGRFEEINAIGYAFGADKLTVTAGRVLLINFRMFDDVATGIIVQGSYIPGMSGGPVIDSGGQVVSMVQRTNFGVGYGVPALYMQAVLLNSDVISQ